MNEISQVRLKMVISRLYKSRSGTAAIEMAIVLPVLLMICLGILAYGIYFGAVHSTAQLAADAARASVPGLTPTERTSLAKAQAYSDANSYPLLDASKLTITAGPSSGDATSFQVQVQYDASALPIWNWATFLPLPSRQIIRSATIKQGGY